MIKTDFSLVKELFLVYPKGFEDGTENLISFFQKLIGLIPDDIKQFILVNNELAGIEIRKMYPHKKIETILIEGFDELWLRDLIGYNTEKRIIKRPIYKPDYCEYLYPANYLSIIKHQVEEILYKTIKADLIEIPLILDGGNLVTNGEIGFITNKVIKQNALPIEDIETIIYDHLKIMPVIIESNENDKLGHSDGYLNFIAKDKLCVSNYPEIGFLKKDISYLKRLNSLIDKYPVEKINIFDRPVDAKVNGGGQFLNDKTKECLNSAVGIYINFLILNDTIILPEYKIPNYKKIMDYNVVNRQILKNLGYKVITLNCDDLAKLGGSLHCISFTN